VLLSGIRLGYTEFYVFTDDHGMTCSVLDFDTILLDMDGTLLDLYFDDQFWNKRVPDAVASQRDMTIDEARNLVFSALESAQGTLLWYDFEHWSEQFNLNLDALQRTQSKLIRPRVGTENFLKWLCKQDKQVILATNAHPKVLTFKLSVIEQQLPAFEHYFSKIVSSSDLGHPKEAADFWHALCHQLQIGPQRAILVDDNPHVLAAARRYGIGGQIAINQPNSHLAPQIVPNFDNVCFLDELITESIHDH